MQRTRQAVRQLLACVPTVRCAATWRSRPLQSSGDRSPRLAAIQSRMGNTTRCPRDLPALDSSAERLALAPPETAQDSLNEMKPQDLNEEIDGAVAQERLVRPLYSMQRCRKDDSRYGKIHFAHHEFETLCGLTADSNWWILTNRRGGDATCVKCIKANAIGEARADSASPPHNQTL